MARSSSVIVAIAFVFYGLLLGAALLWRHVDDAVPFPFSRVAWEGAALRWTGGAILGASLLAFASWWLTPRFAWMRDFAAMIRRDLGVLSLSEVLTLALLSAIAEEAFFRGAMQPAWGLGLASLSFALAHPLFLINRRWWPYTVFAGLAGLALGLLYEYSGDLLAPAAAHGTLNAWNLWYLTRARGPLAES